MKIFNYKVLKDMKWDNEIVNYLSLIHEYRELSVKSIELALKKLVDDEMLEKLGNGNNTYYVRKKI